ncbi:MAG TPA: hypothetical protein VIV40_39070 [Kofleriaceae bacterium]
MALKKLVGLAALGGFLYAHKRRGGTMTLDSFKQTARSLFDDAKTRAKEIRTQAEQKLEENRVGTAGDFASASKSSGIADDVTGYGSPGYGYGTDLNRR